MKKVVIAAATAACTVTSVGAHAQSNVTIFCIVDAGMNYVSNTKAGNGAHLGLGPLHNHNWYNNCICYSLRVATITMLSYCATLAFDNA